MRTYTRARVAGGRYFFTVNLAQRENNDLLIRRVADLREAFRATRTDHPFEVEAIVILPEHLHCIWRLPDGDADFSTRWKLIKARFSRSIIAGERVSSSRARRGERGIWQRRYWQHVIRDERDYGAHLDYLHFNPVRHGYAATVQDWPHSSFHRMVKKGWYPADWGDAAEIADLDVE